MNAATQTIETLELVDQPSLHERPSTALVTTDNSPASMMLAAMDRGANLEQIEKMMELQERWEKREAEKVFREDFAAFRGENIIIPKTRHVDRGAGGSFDQAEYDEVCRRLSPALSAHGFSFRHDQRFGLQRRMIEGVENDIGWVWVTCHLEHRKGHSESLQLEGPPGDLKVNTPTQNMQVTASYLKRQSLLAITGTATGGEDDEAKMRQRRASDDSHEGGDKDAGLLTAGRDAAMNGMASLTAWWGALDAKQRGRLQRDFAQMRKAAQEADHAR
jgi:hypothetical protein